MYDRLRLGCVFRNNASLGPQSCYMVFLGRQLLQQSEGLLFVAFLAVEHAVVATLDGCKPVKRVVVIDENTPAKTVKLVFKKNAPDPEKADDDKE